MVMHYARVVAAFEFKEPRRLPLNRREGRGRAERVVVVDEDEVGPGRIRAALDEISTQRPRHNLVLRRVDAEC